jgi:CBS domain-containing protein
MQVKDAMTPHAEWISPDIPLTEVATIMRDKGIGCLPVGENDRLIGMITDRDITWRAVAAGSDPRRCKARDVMSKGIHWCFEDQGIDDAAHLMEQKKVHHLPVMNRDKRMVGIITLGDLALRGTQSVTGDVRKLASRDASRHVQTH